MGAMSLINDEFMMYLKALDGYSRINRHYCNPLLSRKASGMFTIATEMDT